MAAPSLSNGKLTLRGDATHSSQMVVNYTANKSMLSARVGTTERTFPVSQVKEIDISAGYGDDYVFINPNLNVDAVITLGDGNDIVNAGGGNAQITTGNGNSVIYGAKGSNSINVGDGNNRIIGATGNDQIVAGNGNNSIFGGAGNDSITAGNGDNSLFGGSGNDSIIAGSGNNRLGGGGGNDQLTAGGGRDSLIGFSGDDNLSGGGPKSILHGDAGTNTINGVQSKPAATTKPAAKSSTTGSKTTAKPTTSTKTTGTTHTKKSTGTTTTGSTRKQPPTSSSTGKQAGKTTTNNKGTGQTTTGSTTNNGSAAGSSGSTGSTASAGSTTTGSTGSAASGTTTAPSTGSTGTGASSSGATGQTGTGTTTTPTAGSTGTGTSSTGSTGTTGSGTTTTPSQVPPAPTGGSTAPPVTNPAPSGGAGAGAGSGTTGSGTSSGSGSGTKAGSGTTSTASGSSLVKPVILDLNDNALATAGATNAPLDIIAGVPLFVSSVGSVGAVPTASSVGNPTKGSIFSGVANANNTEFQWNFGDTASYSAGSNRTMYNNLAGYSAAHIYDTPGTYTLTLTTTDPLGNVSSVPLQVNVAANPNGPSTPDAQPGQGVNTSNTIYVDTAGKTVAGGLATVTSIDAAAAVAKADGLAGNFQIRFKRGETFTDTGAAYSFKNVLFGAYGALSMPNPVLQPATRTTFFFNPGGGAAQWTVQDVTLSSPNGSGGVGFDAAHGTQMTIRDSRFQNMLDDVIATVPNGVLVQDNVDSTQVYNYGIHGSGNNWVVLGNNFSGGSKHQPFIRFEDTRGTANAMLSSEHIIFDNNIINGVNGYVGSDFTLRGAANFVYLYKNTFIDTPVDIQGDGAYKINGTEDFSGIETYQYYWVRADSNLVINGSFAGNDAINHMAFTNNVIENFSNNAASKNAGAFVLNNGNDRAMGDNNPVLTMKDLAIVGNTVYSQWPTSTGSFVALDGTTGVIMADNLFVGPAGSTNSGISLGISYLDDKAHQSIFQGKVVDLTRPAETGSLSQFNSQLSVNNDFASFSGTSDATFVSVASGSDITLAQWQQALPTNFSTPVKIDLNTIVSNTATSTVMSDGTLKIVGTAPTGAVGFGDWYDIYGKRRTSNSAIGAAA